MTRTLSQVSFMIKLHNKHFLISGISFQFTSPMFSLTIESMETHRVTSATARRKTQQLTTTRSTRLRRPLMDASEFKPRIYRLIIVITILSIIPFPLSRVRPPLQVAPNNYQRQFLLLFKIFFYCFYFFVCYFYYN